MVRLVADVESFSPSTYANNCFAFRNHAPPAHRRGFVETLTLTDNMRVHNKSPLSLADLLQNVCEITGVDTEAIIRPGKERRLAKARAIFCCLAVREYGYTGKEAGSVTGIGSAGVSIAVQRGEKLMKSEQSMREKIMEIGMIER